MSENEEQAAEENVEETAETQVEQDEDSTSESAIDQEIIQAIPINLTIRSGDTQRSK